MIKKIGVLTSGGDAPGMNAAGYPINIHIIVVTSATNKDLINTLINV